MATQKNIQVLMEGTPNDTTIRLLIEDINTKINYQLLPYLTELGEVIGDVTEASFMIKTSPTDTDVNALYSKTLVDSEVALDTTNSAVTVLISDYTGISIDTKYYVALGIKFSGDVNFREVPATKKFIQFSQDVIRA